MYVKLFMIGVLAAGFVCAQGQGGGGGGDRMPNGLAVPSAGRGPASPLDRMVAACSLSKDQKKQFTSILDAASKSAADLRKQIPAGRQALETAALSGKSPDELKKIEGANGLAEAQMAEIEIKAYADLRKLLDPDQIKSGGSRVYGMLVGLFMKKDWKE